MKIEVQQTENQALNIQVATLSGQINAVAKLFASKRHQWAGEQSRLQSDDYRYSSLINFVLNNRRVGLQLLGKSSGPDVEVDLLIC